MDADLQYPPEVILDLLKMAEQEACDLVAGVSAGDKSTQNRGLESPPNAI